MKFDDIVSKEFNFYGVDGEMFKLGRNVWLAIEDEGDGYRSYLDSIELHEHGGIFFKRPLGKVRVESYDDYSTSNGFCLVDVKDGHLWLRIGTDNIDDYYPYFVFEYHPKPPKS